jgi:cellulose biosynthesis protein BcsQ
MRNGEMRRILEHDPDIAKALDKISAEQKAIESHIAESKQTRQGEIDKVPSNQDLPDEESQSPTPESQSTDQ